VQAGTDSGKGGGAEILKGKDVQDIEELKRHGMSFQAISRLLGIDRKTIRNIVKPDGRPVYGPQSAEAI
jgi:hypothetical protein